MEMFKGYVRTCLTMSSFLTVFRVIKWPIKRPREPGKPGSPAELPKPSRNPFKLFKKRVPPQLHDASHDIPSSPGDCPERRSTLALDTAALVAKTLLIASDAPVISVLKPFAGLADFACQRFQVSSRI
jgi:hypothetical protein